MPWTEITRAQYRRDGLRYASDTRDAEWAVIAPLMPPARWLGRRLPGLRHIFADRVYRDDQLLNALNDCGPWTIEIVKRPEGVKGFQLLPRRWVVERTFAWLGRCRRLAKDFEATIATETAWLFLAHIRLLSRRLARP